MITKPNQQGFTLLETMVAVAVLTVILLPLTGLLLQSGQMVNASEQSTIALYTAQDILEQVKAREGQYANSTGWLALSKPGYHYKLQVKEVDYGMQEVTVVIRYPQGVNKEELSLTMLHSLRLTK